MKQLLVQSDDVNLLGGNVYGTNKPQTSFHWLGGWELLTEDESRWVFMTRHQNAGKRYFELTYCLVGLSVIRFGKIRLI
jgi:hypothetical protein